MTAHPGVGSGARSVMRAIVRRLSPRNGARARFCFEAPRHSRYCRNTKTSRGTEMSVARRNLIDGGYVVILLTIAIANGYLLLPTDAHTREIATVSMVIPV